MFEGDVPIWHDRYVLGNAIQNLARGASLEKLGKWISIATKIADVADKAGLGKLEEEGEGEGAITNRLINMTLSVRITNSEAEVFWKKLKELPFEQFGSSLQCKRCGGAINAAPDVSTLMQMLSDIAKAFGEKMPEAEDDDEHDEPEDVT
jgi:hypothetical protein